LVIKVGMIVINNCLTDWEMIEVIYCLIKWEVIEVSDCATD